MNNSHSCVTDLQLVDVFCETCLQHIDPFVFREINQRGLYHIVNMLPTNTLEAKAVARARLSKSGRYVGDVEIEQIASVVHRLETLRNMLSQMDMCYPEKTIPVLEEMQQHAHFILNYYKQSN